MAHSFTGLKLQGQLGRFGRTALTDIEGYVELPDGKVGHILSSQTTHTHTQTIQRVSMVIEFLESPRNSVQPVLDMESQGISGNFGIAM